MKLAFIRISPGVHPRLGAGHASVALRAKKILLVSFFQVREIVRIETFCLAHLSHFVKSAIQMFGSGFPCMCNG